MGRKIFEERTNRSSVQLSRFVRVFVDFERNSIAFLARLLTEEKKGGEKKHEESRREIDDPASRGIDREGNSNKYEALVARIELPVVFVSASTATIIHQR